jgi:hypothetical protein
MKTELLVLILLAIFGCVFCDIEKCHKEFIQTLKYDNDEICKNLYENYTQEFHESVSQELRQSDNETCIFKTFEKYNVFELYLRGLTTQLLYNNYTNEDFENEIDESKNNILKSFRVLCVPKNIEGSNDENKDDNNSSTESTNLTSDDYCEMKYFIENQIIDNAKYKFEIIVTNSSNNCEETASKIDEFEKEYEKEMFSEFENDKKDTFFGLSAIEASECSKEKYKKEKILLHMIAVRTVMKFKLTEVQKNAIEEDFHKFIVSNLIFLLECMQKI